MTIVRTLKMRWIDYAQDQLETDAQKIMNFWKIAFYGKNFLIKYIAITKKYRHCFTMDYVIEKVFFYFPSNFF